ncbi:hypothetical protein LY632_09035 [Erythrobacter sp. SDW2]|uniref:hypothetical protein n=1 Tax=Erythrobacter sp. SDW2 TaxID=2907154 RepID=UPI001F42B5FF|nr:hypothetical protein [Erythrobacter sp. SDW2]UIP05851.1 hypothetical protein LY632_09035 [Erythrobacter sp. SDW2]
MSNPDNRDALRQRIEQGEARLAERDIARAAGDAAKAATDFVRAHPVASVAGVAVIALVIGAMTRPGRRLGHRAAGLASYATEAGIAYALGMLDAAGDLADDVREAGTEKLEDLGDNVERTTRKAKREGAYLAASARDAVHDLGRRAGRRAGRAVRQTRKHLTH